MIDTHTHIYDEAFDEDRNEVIENALSKGITTVILPNVDTSTIDSIMDMTATYPDFCKPAFGLHPTEVKEDYKAQLQQIECIIRQARPVAIGEIGLDFYWDSTYKEQQIKAFEKQLDLAIELKLPVIIHVRKAYTEAIAIVSYYIEKGLKGVFHCFGGGVQEAKKIVEFGFYLGIGGVVTFKNSKLDEIISTIGLEHILLETDAPYLAPVPFRGKRNEPAYVSLVCEKLATVFSVPYDKIDEITTNNAVKLFNL